VRNLGGLDLFQKRARIREALHAVIVLSQYAGTLAAGRSSIRFARAVPLSDESSALVSCLKPTTGRRVAGHIRHTAPVLRLRVARQLRRNLLMQLATCPPGNRRRQRLSSEMPRDAGALAPIPVRLQEGYKTVPHHVPESFSNHLNREAAIICQIEIGTILQEKLSHI
jgi:hypothetical protein